MANGDLVSFPLASGQLGGLIADPSGAVVPNATVIVTNSDTGFSTSTVSDDEGRWIVSNLPSGRVKINASANGFKSIARDAIYNADQPAHASFSLPVGSVSETVEVNPKPSQSTDVTSPICSTLKAGVSQQAASANVMNLTASSCRSVASSDRCSPRGYIVSIRQAAGAGRGNQSGVQLQEQRITL